MKKFAENLKRQAEENPVVILVIAVAAITASAKLVDSAGHARGSNAYAKQVNYRVKNNK